MLTKVATEIQRLFRSQNIVDPQTRVLKYANKRVMDLSPEVQPGNVCHRALMGRDGPCPGCPAPGILETRNARALLRDGITGESILAEATLIPWEGDQSCLMTDRRLPK